MTMFDDIYLVSTCASKNMLYLNNLKYVLNKRYTLLK